MKPFSEQVIQHLNQLVKAGQAIDTDQAKDCLGMNAQQFQRMATQDSLTFPERKRIGRKWYLNPALLQQWALAWNALIRGIAVSGVASLIHSTVPTARRMSRAPGFPAPLGKINGRERWARAEIVEWQRKRVDGAKLPPIADVPAETPKRRKTEARAK